MPVGQKCIYLTFDDGPELQVGPSVLQLLEQHNAKATFFLSGNKLSEYDTHRLPGQKGWVETLRQQGHGVGNHGWHHLNGWKTSTATYLRNAEKAESLIPSKLFRPPFGRITPCQSRRLIKQGYQIIMWSVMTGDHLQQTSTERLIGKALGRISDGDIVVLHDSLKASVHTGAILKAILEKFSRLGYRFPALPTTKDKARRLG